MIASGSRRARSLSAAPLAFSMIASVALFTTACSRVSHTTDSPSPQTAPEPPATLARDVEILAGDEFEGRGVGTAGGRRAGAYLRDRLAQAGLRSAGPSGYDQTFVAKRGDASLDAVNLLAVVPNRRLDQPPHDPTGCTHPLVVLSAHYDHLGRRGDDVFNGADDNASGVAAALWIAQQAVDGDAPYHLLVALLDAEEVGLQGASALLEHWPDGVVQRIVANLNLDMIGRSDAGILWVAGAAHTAWLGPVVAELEAFEEIEVRAGRDTPQEPPDWTLSSDHAVFHRAGRPFLYFGVDDHSDYHRPTDDADKLDMTFLRQSAEVVRLALQAIGREVASGRNVPSG